jgi:hypothetical protein
VKSYEGPEHPPIVEEALQGGNRTGQAVRCGQKRDRVLFRECKEESEEKAGKIVSYIRWGEQDSNVYVIGAQLIEDGPCNGFWCVGCDHQNAKTYDVEEFVAHLNWHRNKGDVVPDKVFEDIRKSRS